MGHPKIKRQPSLPRTYIRVKIRPKNSKHNAAWRIVSEWLLRRSGAPNLVNAVLLYQDLLDGNTAMLYDLFSWMRSVLHPNNTNSTFNGKHPVNGYHEQQQGQAEIKVVAQEEVSDDDFMDALTRSLGL